MGSEDVVDPGGPRNFGYIVAKITFFFFWFFFFFFFFFLAFGFYIFNIDIQ